MRTLNETARQSLAETREVMNRQLLELQGLVDARFAKIIETNASASEALGAKLESKFSEIRTSVDASLEKVRAGNEARLEEMRATVQEKLDRTLSERLTASFRTVDEKLGLVQTGLGEMRTMAESVRDLKGILANVKTRGTFGETQLAAIAVRRPGEGRAGQPGGGGLCGEDAGRFGRRPLLAPYGLEVPCRGLCTPA